MNEKQYVEFPDDTERQEIVDSICEEFGIIPISDNAYAIAGKTYTVKFCGRGDDGNVFLWECNCPAGSHGKHCKHVDLVGAAAGRINDELGYE